MPFFLEPGAGKSDVTEAINYLLANFTQTQSINPNSGQITSSSGVVGYLYRYLHIKYADSFDGSVNFSDSPTNKTYFGINNSDSSTESTNYADYIWLPFDFSTTNFFYYIVSGGRQFRYYLGPTAPSVNYLLEDSIAIDLDLITNSLNTQSDSNLVLIWLTT